MTGSRSTRRRLNRTAVPGTTLGARLRRVRTAAARRQAAVPVGRATSSHSTGTRRITRRRTGVSRTTCRSLETEAAAQTVVGARRAQGGRRRGLREATCASTRRVATMLARGSRRRLKRASLCAETDSPFQSRHLQTDYFCGVRDCLRLSLRSDKGESRLLAKRAA